MKEQGKSNSPAPTKAPCIQYSCGPEKTRLVGDSPVTCLFESLGTGKARALPVLCCGDICVGNPPVELRRWQPYWHVARLREHTVQENVHSERAILNAKISMASSKLARAQAIACSSRGFLVCGLALLVSMSMMMQVLAPYRTSWLISRNTTHILHSRFYSECFVDLVLEERGATLLHNWPDDELLQRAGNTSATYRMLADEITSSSKPGFGGQYVEHYLRSTHREYCKLQLQEGQSSGVVRNGKLRIRLKIAFMFLTQGSLPFAPLWDAFFAGNEHLFNVYVHSWPFPGVNVFGRKADHAHFWGRFIPSDTTERATALLIAATRRLLANALLDDPMNEYFALLSEHCIPIRGFQHVYNVLTSSNKSFVEQIDESELLWSRYTVRGESAMLPEVEFSQFRIGSQFLVLVRRHALLFVRDNKYWPKFNLPCFDPDECYPEEHYFPTVLAIEDPNGTNPFTLTSVIWQQAEAGHPKTYPKEEVCLELITFLQHHMGGVHIVARKFSDDSIDALMGLSEHILRNYIESKD